MLLTVRQYNQLAAIESLISEASESGALDILAGFDCYDTVSRFASLVSEVVAQESPQITE